MKEEQELLERSPEEKEHVHGGQAELDIAEGEHYYSLEDEFDIDFWVEVIIIL